MQEAGQLGLDQIQPFLEASQGIRFDGKTREQIYGWVEKVLVHHDYQQQGRSKPLGETEVIVLVSSMR